VLPLFGLLQASSLFPALGPSISPFTSPRAGLGCRVAQAKSLEYSLDIVPGIESIRLPALSFTNPWESSRFGPGEMRSSRLFRRPHFRFDCFYCMPPNVKQVPSDRYGEHWDFNALAGVVGSEAAAFPRPHRR
jgi:hypothetical protein